MSSLTIHYPIGYIVASLTTYNIHFVATHSDMRVYAVFPSNTKMKYLNNIVTIIIKCGVTLHNSATILLTGLLL